MSHTDRLNAPDAGSGDSCQILQVSGDFPGPLDGDVSKRLVCLQCGMCLRVFPSNVNTVLSRKKNVLILVEWLHSENVTGSCCAFTAEKQLCRIKTGTRVVGFLRLKQPVRPEKRGRTLGDRLKCVPSECYFVVLNISVGAAKMQISQTRIGTNKTAEDEITTNRDSSFAHIKNRHTAAVGASVVAGLASCATQG